MVRRIDWEERFWQLSHDIVVRLAVEHHELNREPAETVASAISLAAATCRGFQIVDKGPAIVAVEAES